MAGVAVDSKFQSFLCINTNKLQTGINLYNQLFTAVALGHVMRRAGSQHLCLTGKIDGTRARERKQQNIRLESALFFHLHQIPMPRPQPPSYFMQI